jgi:hypothetical protein
MKSIRQASDCDDLFERRLIQDIDQNGYSVVHQAGSCYTVGLWHKHRHPELIVFGLPAERGQQLLGRAVEEIQQGRRLEVGTPIDRLTEDYCLRAMPVKVEHHREYLSYNRWFYRGDDFHAWQLIWPDADHQFPDDPRHPQRLRELQPQLQ